MILEGYVTDKNKSPVANALIEVKGEDFITLFSAESNESGYYKLDMPAGKYPFLTAVKDYAINSERDFRKTQQKISNNIENSFQMIA